MPLILPPPDDPGAVLGVDAIAVRRWSLVPGSTGAEIARTTDEVLLYVISGTGTATVGEQGFALGAESVLWLDPGDVCVMEAGEQGLEVLEARAP